MATLIANLGTVLFNGGGAPSITSNGQSFNNVTLNNAAGVFTAIDAFVASATLTVTNTSGVTFSSTVSAATIALTATTGTIAFNGAVTATVFTAAAAGYNVTLNGGGTITNLVTFNNTGTLSIGAAGLTFTGGATDTAGAKSF
ncbi:MAG: hypothetical protein ABSG21_18890, partial [Spirochaetia bacterium]